MLKELPNCIFFFCRKSQYEATARANPRKWNRFSIICYWKLKPNNNPCQRYTTSAANWNQFISLLCFVSERTLPILTRGQCSTWENESLPGPSDFTKCKQGRSRDLSRIRRRRLFSTFLIPLFTKAIILHKVFWCWCYGNNFTLMLLLYLITTSPRLAKSKCENDSPSFDI